MDEFSNIYTQTLRVCHYGLHREWFLVNVERFWDA